MGLGRTEGGGGGEISVKGKSEREKRMRDEWGREQVTSLPVLLSG